MSRDEIKLLNGLLEPYTMKHHDDPPNALISPMNGVMDEDTSGQDVSPHQTMSDGMVF